MKENETNKTGTKEQEAKEKKSWMPHIFAVLFFIIIIASLASYIIPAGEFERVTMEDGREIIDPGTFEIVERTPVGIFDFMFAIPTGFIETAEIVFGILMIGGMFAVIERTGIISLGVGKLANTFSNRGLWVIPILMIPFAIITTFTGQIELSLVYLPAILPLMLRLGFDKVTAAGAVLISTIAGFAVALTAPANLGVSQSISQLPLYSGMGYRIVILTIILLTGILFVVRYAKKVRSNPELSITYGDNDSVQNEAMGDTNGQKATTRQKLASLVVLIAFGVLLWGLLQHGWYFRELSGLYIMTGIIVGVVGGLGISQISESFVQGFKNILLGAMVVGIARGVAVVLSDGNIMDTIIYAAGNLVEAMPSGVTATIMLIVQALLNFLIPSGSGQAMVTMPIMSGLADLSGVTRQTAVLAFLFGDGFSNIFYPTSGYFMAALAIAGIKWEKWIKFIWPLLLIWYGLAIVFLFIAQFMNYS
ncbi:YfcC family protein [Pseudogracilibacillus auburnensis]|uniref:Putative ion transporter superfamily protein YfcC n=1 Tax=Pseudogracilibacillus auburnensis TaxID=1494959 RepID=A0A2V3VI58_9BACI|nr:TIGR00366 family protein [Pseudogracilibacillus auburnensis]PXW81512.1 putative ion transporter superfamily protein YfcC [Pseudogracilibacillus auburnensis]